MSISFSDNSGKTGIVEQARALARLDSAQWPTVRIANSCNNWMDRIVGYAIAADTRFRFDDTNHSKLPQGTTNLVAGQSDYSFLTDEQGNSIITLTGISRMDADGKEYPLREVDRNDPGYDISSYGVETATPEAYDKIADNIIRLDRKPPATITGGLKFYFQRTPSYFTASDTTKAPGFSPLLHRGFVIAAAYDMVLALDPDRIRVMGAELQREEEKMRRYFGDRNADITPVFGQVITPFI
jgi:hypothetical protein